MTNYILPFIQKNCLIKNERGEQEIYDGYNTRIILAFILRMTN